MKQKPTDDSAEIIGLGRALGKVCVTSCQQMLAQITAAKAAIFAESYSARKSQARLLWLALNEAEAVAWQTMYPHLVFPVLATEKVQAVIAWDAHQQSVWRTTPAFALAA
jgi:hypothetical protein